MTARLRRCVLGLPLAAVVAWLFAAAPAARAQGLSQYAFLFPDGATVLSQTDIGLQVSGEVTVSFHGDPAAGCAAYGVCGYSGTVTVLPRSGDLLVVKVRRGHRIGYSAALALAPGPSGYLTATRVERSAPGQQGGACADAQSGLPGSFSQASVHGRSLSVAVLGRGGSLLLTRCAGPADADLAGAGPQATVPLRTVMLGRMTLDLSGNRTFLAHGFAGTITSTLVLRLGTPVRSGSSGARFPPGIKAQRVRTVTERLSVIRAAGGVTAAVQGTADPVVCRLLDTCGLRGTLSQAPVSRGATAEVLAMGPASLPYGDFLAALGLNPSGSPKGIAVSLAVSLPGDVSAVLSQSGGSCTDTAPTGELALVLSGVEHRFAGQAVSGGSWRTRCPGPIFDSGPTLLSGSLPRSAVGRRQFTIDMRGTGSLEDDGYTIAVHGQLMLGLRREGITQQVTTQPTG
jgi:hypothetical protein